MRLPYSTARCASVLSCCALLACRPAAPAAAQLAEESMRRLVLGGQVVVLDSGQSLDSIAASYSAPLFRMPNAPEDEVRACIEVTHRGSAARLHLVTNDLGGSEHAVMGYTLTHDSNPNCVRGSRPLEFSAGETLKLGMRWDGTAVVFETSPLASADSFVYFRSVPRLDSLQLTPPRHYDAFTRVVVRVLDGRLREYTVWYGEVD
jgi:hypothetical protein